MIRSSTILTLIAAAVPLVGLADVQPAELFADHMVIQRETLAPVWGTADVGEQVSVSGSWGARATATADEAGKWMVKLQTPSAGGPYTLSIEGKNTIEITDVLSGEVWFCSGQSNMDFVMSQVAVWDPERAVQVDRETSDVIKQEMETAQDDWLRQFNVERQYSPLEPLSSVTGSWLASSPENNPNFSATAYFFARELRRELQVPVGLIKAAYSGTQIEPWMPLELFQRDSTMAAYYAQQLAAMHEKMASWDPQQAEQQYQQKLKKWQVKQQGREPQLASPPDQDRQVPATLFNGMVHPVIPYAIKGVIWYQGESNTKRNALQYGDNFSALIERWRAHWGQGDFPFYYAQLAAFRQPSSKPLKSDPWACIRDQQRRTLRVKNTGMAVLSDVGELKDIHPRNKVDVGKRLSLWALKNDYGCDIAVCSGPLYQSHSIEGNAVVITFDSAGSGLMAGSKSGLEAAQPSEAPLQGFQICGSDGKWVWAEAAITGKDSVRVSHPQVQVPVEVRYAWGRNPATANLYNKEGLPASLFTTAAEVVK